MTVTDNTQTDDILAALEARIAPVHLKRKFLKVLIYGPSGGGKTVFQGGAPSPLIVDVEKGAFSLNNHPDLYDISKVNTFEYRSFKQLETLVEKLNEGALPHIETLAIDSMSELHKRGLAEITEREFKKRPGSRNRYVPETEDHTENNEHIRRLTSALRDLNRNIIVTAHHRTVQNKDGSLGSVFPDFSEKLANTLAGIFDVVGFLMVKEIDGKEVRSLRVRTDGIVTCKTRLGALPDVIIDPTWADLWSAFEKQEDEETPTG